MAGQNTFRHADHAPVPFWRDIRVIQVVAQIVFFVVVVVLFYTLITNMVHNLDKSNMGINYHVYDRPFGVKISEGGLNLDPQTSSNIDALRVGIINTLRVVLVGLVGATVLGVLVGIGRLSTNFLVRNTAISYIEIFRNTPLLVQLYFIYRGLRLTMPMNLADSYKLPGPVFINRRAINYPAVNGTTTAWMVYAAVGLGLIVGIILWRWRLHVQDRTGQPARTLMWFSLALLLFVAVGWVASGDPFTVEYPTLTDGRNFVGGDRLTAEYVALTLGLVLYTAAFIADIVRAGIQAVSYGQIEAARAQGFSGSQTLRLIVLPQALRLIIPPLGNQYLNLAKNSSLGIAIGFFDVYNISNVIQNQTGQPVAVFSIMMLTYLSMSLIISAIMNGVNYKLRLRSR